jgi:hypothetical protein
MPGDAGVTVVTTLVCFFICTRGCGCIERPAFPAPSDVSDARYTMQNSRLSRGEIAEVWVFGRGENGKVCVWELHGRDCAQYNGIAGLHPSPDLRGVETSKARS